ncbi:PEPxxWA-CTERM sorting domain-containing protein [Sphingomonas sp. 1P06PA]|uniref:PEPxxWA-CTERM sorting domain-containing protein n=1 Tax=Sphingomonas sp. 1P06PA TaxID=554121 RepID=UPI0039A52197
MRIPTIALAAAAMLVGASPALSATVIDFDSLPGGGTVADETPISTQYAALGVTFSASFEGDPVLPVATNYAGGPTGPLYSGNYLANSSTGNPITFPPGGGVILTPRYDLLSISFDGVADNLSLSFNNFSLVGRTTFSAYDAGGNLLETFTTNAGNGWAVRALTSDGIARLDLTTTDGGYYGLDQLTFDLVSAPAVPEPAAWALMIGGFGLVGGTMRQRRAIARPA